MLIEENLSPILTLECHKWRTEVLWNEKCDHLYWRNIKVVKKLYDKNSGWYAAPGAPWFMAPDEFFDLVNEIGVVSDTFGSWEIGTLYNLSMMTQIDELTSNRHVNMVIVEFMEAIAWVADKIPRIPTLWFDPDPSNPDAQVVFNSEELDLFLEWKPTKHDYSFCPFENRIETVLFLMIW